MENNFFDYFLIYIAMFLLGVIVALSSTQEMLIEPFESCLDMAIENEYLVWQKELPYCKIPVVINGVERLLSISDYNNFVK